MRGAGQIARIHAFGLGEASLDAEGVHGNAAMQLGDRGLLALVVGPEPADRTRAAFERDLDETVRWWRGWAGGVEYRGPWRGAVVRSSLVLRMLVSSTTGAILAAGTTSLPEVPGGVRNWDYRYSWVRDSLLVLDAFFAVGRDDEATEYFAWLRNRVDPHTGRIGVLYDVRGARVHARARTPAQRLARCQARTRRQLRSRPIPTEHLRHATARVPPVRLTRARWTPERATTHLPEGGGPALARLAPAGRRHLGGARPIQPAHALENDVRARAALRRRPRAPRRHGRRVRRPARRRVRRRGAVRRLTLRRPEHRRLHQDGARRHVRRGGLDAARYGVQPMGWARARRADNRRHPRAPRRRQDRCSTGTARTTDCPETRATSRRAHSGSRARSATADASRRPPQRSTP